MTTLSNHSICYFKSTPGVAPEESEKRGAAETATYLCRDSGDRDKNSTLTGL